MDIISSFCGTSLEPGGTKENPKNMNTLIRACLSGLFRLKQTKTFSHSSFSSANSSNETKLSRDPSGRTLIGMSTYKVPFTNRVFHSTSFWSLNGHLKLSNSESGFSAISSKSINSEEFLWTFKLCIDSHESVEVSDDDDDCFRVL